MAEEEQMTTLSGDPHPAAAIADMIDFAYAQDFNKANTIFNDMMGDKISDALDQEKISLADQIFNDQEETDDEELEAGDEADEADEVEDGEEVEYDEDSEEVDDEGEEAEEA